MKNKVFKNVVLTCVLPVCMYGILCIINPSNFLNFSTLLMIITQCLPYLVIGWSMLFGMSVGLWDFSVGARLLFAGLIGMRCSQIAGLPGFIIGSMVASIVLSGLVGAVYSFLKIPSIIAGFAGMLIFEAMGVNYQNAISVTIDSNYLILGKSPYIYILVALVYLAVYFSFNRTKFGYQIKAIGGNENVARSMGINSNRLKLMTFIIGGLFLGFATIMYVSNNGTVSMQTGMASMTKCFTPMMGVMIGMLLTCCNPVIGVFVGELCITMVSSGMVALGVPFRLQNVVVGGFLIIFMAIQLNKDQVKKKFTSKKTSPEVEGAKA